METLSEYFRRATPANITAISSSSDTTICFLMLGAENTFEPSCKVVQTALDCLTYFKFFVHDSH